MVKSSLTPGHIFAALFMAEIRLATDRYTPVLTGPVSPAAKAHTLQHALRTLCSIPLPVSLAHSLHERAGTSSFLWVRRASHVEARHLLQLRLCLMQLCLGTR